MSLQFVTEACPHPDTRKSQSNTRTFVSVAYVQGGFVKGALVRTGICSAFDNRVFDCAGRVEGGVVGVKSYVSSRAVR